MRRALISACIFGMLACLALIFLPGTAWKLIVSAILLILGVLSLFSGRQPAARPTQRPQPAQNAAQAQATDSAMPAFFRGILFFGIIVLVVGAMVSAAIYLVKSAAGTGGTISSGFIMGHDYNQAQGKHFYGALTPDRVYDAFPLHEGQHWKWYFEKDICYRVKASGNEAWECLSADKFTGTEFSAEREGTLQIMTEKKNNYANIKRLWQY